MQMTYPLCSLVAGFSVLRGGFKVKKTKNFTRGQECNLFIYPVCLSPACVFISFAYGFLFSQVEVQVKMWQRHF